MNLIELIQKHNETSAQLVQAIESDDSALVEQYDKKLSATLADIIVQKADCDTLLYEKVSFLLGLVLPTDQRTEMTTRICEQILLEISETGAKR